MITATPHHVANRGAALLSSGLKKILSKKGNLLNFVCLGQDLGALWEDPSVVHQLLLSAGHSTSKVLDHKSLINLGLSASSVDNTATHQALGRFTQPLWSQAVQGFAGPYHSVIARGVSCLAHSKIRLFTNFLAAILHNRESYCSLQAVYMPPNSSQLLRSLQEQRFPARHVARGQGQYSPSVTRTEASVRALNLKPSMPADLVHRASIVWHYGLINEGNHSRMVVGCCRKAKEMG